MAGLKSHLSSSFLFYKKSCSGYISCIALPIRVHLRVSKHCNRVLWLVARISVQGHNHYIHYCKGYNYILHGAGERNQGACTVLVDERYIQLY